MKKNSLVKKRKVKHMTGPACGGKTEFKKKNQKEIIICRIILELDLFLNKSTVNNNITQFTVLRTMSKNASIINNNALYSTQDYVYGLTFKPGKIT